jgi:hypothetical protein
VISGGGNAVLENKSTGVEVQQNGTTSATLAQSSPNVTSGQATGWTARAIPGDGGDANYYIKVYAYVVCTT